MYNGQFRQALSVIIKTDTHDEALYLAKIIKQQCEAWRFCVKYTEHKSARKGDVLRREIMIYQTAYAGDTLIFKEALRRICQFYQIRFKNLQFIDRGTEPENN